MNYDDPRWRPLMDLEGLRKWIVADPTIMEGYRVLNEAADRQGLLRLARSVVQEFHRLMSELGRDEFGVIQSGDFVAC